MLSRPLFTPALLGSLLAATACEPQNHGGATTPVADAAAQDGAAAWRNDGSQEQTGSLTVQIESSAPSVCAGQCSTLTAQVAGMHGNLSFGWSDSADLSPTRTVCPTSTTSYRVDVSTTSQAVELTREPESGSASTTVTVRDCTDGGSPQPALPGCSFRIPVEVPPPDPTGWKPSTWLTASPMLTQAGEIYVVAAVRGKARFGNDLFGGEWDINKADPNQVVLAKLDASCRLLWAKEFKSGLSYTHLLSAALDERDNLVLLAEHLDTDGRSQTGRAITLSKLDSQGQILWEKSGMGLSFASSLSVGHDLSVGPGGLIAVSGVGSSCTALQKDACFALFDGAGRELWSGTLNTHPDSLLESGGGALGFDRDGNVLVTGVARDGIHFLVNGVRRDAGWGPVAYLARLTPQGTFTRLVTVPTPNIQPGWQGYGALSAQTAGGTLVVFQEQTPPYPAIGMLAMWRIANDGTSYTQRIERGEIQNYWPGSDDHLLAFAYREPGNQSRAILVDVAPDGTRREVDVSTGVTNVGDVASRLPDGRIVLTVQEHDERGVRAVVVLKRASFERSE